MLKSLERKEVPTLNRHTFIGERDRPDKELKTPTFLKGQGMGPVVGGQRGLLKLQV